MICACSHLVLATKNVSRMADFFSSVFEIKAHFQNETFVEFILPSKFRVAFFEPTGSTQRYFSIGNARDAVSIGVTVENVDNLYSRIIDLQKSIQNMQVSGSPKNHAWGERSFLLIDPDDNRWEITQSPSIDGLLVPRKIHAHTAVNFQNKP